ncbi:MAG: protein translocase subunit SecD [Hyphomicrobiaceae bacterium]
MLQFSTARMIAIAVICLAALVFATPNFFEKSTVDAWPDWLPKKQLKLGLDLRGGAHLLLTMDTKELRQNMLENLREDVRANLREARIGTVGTGLSKDGVRVRIGRPTDMPAALKSLAVLSQPLSNNFITGSHERNLTVTQKGAQSIELSLTEAGLKARVSDAMSGAIETVRRRVDAIGTTEPTIARQGEDRILVQAPSANKETSQEDVDKLKKVLGETAKLSFHEVHPTQGFPANRLPRRGGYLTYEAHESSDRAGSFYYLKKVPVVEGGDLVNANPGFDQRTQEPIITFRFNQIGARKFGRFTAENVNRPFAIVLDNKVLSAPNINEPILGGSGQISGGFTPETANNLAIQLKSGALPAKLTIVEERTVGPSLGADSIKSGQLAGIVGVLATIALTIFVYGTFGIFAVAGLIINGLMIVAIMSVIGSTLTLPGIAGLILTIGMAVDANVLIYERIREELRNGKSPINAIDTGFGRAMVTIFDSQLTTFAAAVIMFWLGSGPIRGFAVTLSIGIFTSIITAVVVVRLMVALWVSASRRKSRNIEVPI